VSDATTPLFPALLGASFASLPERVRRLHLSTVTHTYRGRASIARGRNWLGRLCGLAAGLPAASEDLPLQVEIAILSTGEQWARQFGAQQMRSRMQARDGLLSERLGLTRFDFALSVEHDGLHWRVRRVRALGVPLPAGWFAGVHAIEFERDARYGFEVEAKLPLIGLLVHYRGWLDNV
jgi:Domain of unknown function (DUF4166)